MSEASILHPDDNRQLRGKQFMAWGLMSSHFLRPYCVLQRDDDSAKMAGGMHLAAAHPRSRRWFVFFDLSKHPDSTFGDDDGKTYTLELYNVSKLGSPLGNPADVARNIRFKTTVGGIVVDYPTNSDTQCVDNFIAYGSFNASDTAAVEVTDTLGNNITQAEYIFNDESGFWCAFFPTLTPSASHIITATGSTLTSVASTPSPVTAVSC
jgi:hypothetical protein